MKKWSLFNNRNISRYMAMYRKCLPLFSKNRKTLLNISSITIFQNFKNVLWRFVHISSPFWLQTDLKIADLLKPFSTGILWKIGILNKTKNATINGCISKASANSESKLPFSESSFNFLQNRVVFCTL